MKKTLKQTEFEQIYREYSGRIYSFAIGISEGDTYLSEEILQMTFTKLWEHWEELNSKEKVLSYLFTTAKHIFLNYCNHEMVKKIYSDYILTHQNYIDNYTELQNDAKSLEEYIKTIVSKMPTVRQKVFILSRFEHKSNKEIARLLEISEKTVEVHITLALKELRDKLN